LPSNQRSAAELASLTALLVGLSVRGALLAATAVAVIYLATLVFGFVEGFAFPMRVFAIWPQGRALAGQEFVLPYVVLSAAAIGALSAGSPGSSLKREPTRVSGAGGVHVLGRILAHSDHGHLPVLSRQSWVGVERPGDYHSVAIADSFRSATPERICRPADAGRERPVRSLVRAADRRGGDSQRSRPADLLFRDWLPSPSGGRLALATTIAARSVTRWRGPWAGLAFFGLVYLLLRPYLSTFLTEPLGLLWSLAAIPYVVRALRQRSLAAAAIALALICGSQLTRSGSLVTIPTFALWMLWTARREKRGLARAGGLCARARWVVGARPGYLGSGSVGCRPQLRCVCGLATGTWDACSRSTPGLARAPTEAVASNQVRRHSRPWRGAAPVRTPAG
jgi:hypothetical protein